MKYSVYIVCTKGNAVVKREASFNKFSYASHWECMTNKLWQYYGYTIQSRIVKGE